RRRTALAGLRLSLGDFGREPSGQPADRASRGVAGAAGRQRAGAAVLRGRPAGRLHHLLRLQPRARPDAPARGAGHRHDVCLRLGDRRRGAALPRPLADAHRRTGMSAGTEQVRTFAVTEEDDGIRLDRWFRRNLPEVSFGQVSRWARTGQLRLDGKRAAPGDRILVGQSIRVPPQGEEAPEAPKKKAPDRPRLTDEEIRFVRSLVIYEDAAAIVVNKPPGLATQGGT